MNLPAAEPPNIVNLLGQIGPIDAVIAAGETGAAFEQILRATTTPNVEPGEGEGAKDAARAPAVQAGESGSEDASEPPLAAVLTLNLPAPSVAAAPGNDPVTNDYSAPAAAQTPDAPPSVTEPAAGRIVDTTQGATRARIDAEAIHREAPPARAPSPFLQSGPLQSVESPLAAPEDSPSLNRTIEDQSARSFDAAHSSIRPAPFRPDEARPATEAKNADQPAAIAAIAQDALRTGGEHRISVAPAKGAASPEAAPAPAITVVASRQTADGAIELRLDPPELGGVSIDLVSDASGAVKAVVNADRAETLDLIRRHIDIFKGELARNGFGDVDMTFGGERRGGDAPPPRAQSQQRWTSFSDAEFDVYASISENGAFDVFA